METFSYSRFSQQVTYAVFKILLSSHLVIKLWPFKIIREGKEDPSVHIVTRAVTFSQSPPPCLYWVFIPYYSITLSCPWFAGGNPLSSIAYMFFGSMLVFTTNFSTRSNHPLYYQETVSVLSDHPRWMFKKNSMEFFVGLDYYLYYFYSGCTATSPQSYVPPECSTTSWPYHVTWLLKFPSYLYLNPIVHFEVLD